MSRTVRINGVEVVLVDKKLFTQLIHDSAQRMRENKRKRLCTLQEACDMMGGIHYNTFYSILKDPECKIKKSKIRGKYLLESIEKEIARREK